MIRWMMAAAGVAIVILVVIVATPGPGYSCGATHGYDARCLSDGDEVDLTWTSASLGLDAGSASAEEIERRRRDLIGGPIRLGMGEYWPFLIPQHVLYCRAEFCELDRVSDDSYRYVVQTGRLIYWSLLPEEAFTDDPDPREQRKLDRDAAYAGGYDCSEDWGPGFVCFDEGDVVTDVKQHGGNGEAITPAGAHFNEAGDQLDFAFGTRAAIYSIQLWMNCIAERCVLGVSDQAGNAGEVIEGSFAVRRDSPR